jgi:hypothetical protein
VLVGGIHLPVYGECYGALNTGNTGSNTSLMYNYDTSACTITNPLNLLAADPVLGSFDFHDGLTPTHQLLRGSPAIDAAERQVNFNEDQRGVYRPLGMRCDIGAYVSAPPSFLPIVRK